MKATQPLQTRDYISKTVTMCDFMKVREKEELPDEKIQCQKPTTSLSPHQINSLLSDPLMSEFSDTVTVVLFFLINLCQLKKDKKMFQNKLSGSYMNA